ncbi:MAG: ABC transporter permease subunit, partial [Tepidiformaceae bacterium]
MTTSTTVQEQPRGRFAADPLGFVLQNAHWLAGLGLVILWVVWLETSIGGSWSSGQRRNLYLANVMLLYMMVAIGLNLISGYVGAASIGHIGFFAIGAYTMAILTTDYGWNAWLAIGAGALVSTAASLPVGLILLRLSGWYFSVVTLLLVVVVNDIILQQSDLTGGGAGIFGVTMPSIGSRQLDSHDYIYLVGGINVVVFLMLRYMLDRTRWGRAFLGVRDAEPAARAVGIQPFVVQASTLAMSAFLAGLAGALFAPLPGIITPDSFPILDSIFFLLAVLAGGMGTVPGPVVGTLTLYLVPEWLNRQRLLEDYSYLVYGVLLLLFVIFLPEGLVGGVRRYWHRFFGARMVRRPSAADWPATPADAASLALAHLRSRTDSSTTAAAIRVDGVSKAFSGVAALSNISVVVNPGTIHALIGPNGSGKTTLVNVISGFYKQDAGSVATFGHRLRRGGSSRAIRHGIARTFQTPQMLRARSALDNVMLGAHSRGRVTMLDGLLPLPHVWRERKRAEATARACIALVGLDASIEDTPVGALPFAHQRLLEIARALAGAPHVLLLDEPASGLHP